MIDYVLNSSGFELLFDTKLKKLMKICIVLSWCYSSKSSQAFAKLVRQHKDNTRNSEACIVLFLYNHTTKIPNPFFVSILRLINPIGFVNAWVYITLVVIRNLLYWCSLLQLKKLSLLLWQKVLWLNGMVIENGCLWWWCHKEY